MQQDEIASNFTFGGPGFATYADDGNTICCPIDIIIIRTAIIRRVLD